MNDYDLPIAYVKEQPVVFTTDIHLNMKADQLPWIKERTQEALFEIVPSAKSIEISGPVKISETSRDLVKAIVPVSFIV